MSGPRGQRACWAASKSCKIPTELVHTSRVTAPRPLHPIPEMLSQALFGCAVDRTSGIATHHRRKTQRSRTTPLFVLLGLVFAAAVWLHCLRSGHFSTWSRRSAETWSGPQHRQGAGVQRKGHRAMSPSRHAAIHDDAASEVHSPADTPRHSHRRHRQAQDSASYQDSQSAQAPADEFAQANASQQHSSSGSASGSTPSAERPRLPPSVKSMYELNATGADGSEHRLGLYRDMVTLVVAMDANSPFRDENFHGLLQTFHKYRNHGFRVLAFPCSQDGSQNTDVHTYAATLHTGFSIFNQVDVAVHPVFQFLQSQLPTGSRGITCNFDKVLVGGAGLPLRSYGSDYDIGRIESELYEVLAELLKAYL